MYCSGVEEVMEIDSRVKALAGLNRNIKMTEMSSNMA